MIIEKANGAIKKLVEFLDENYKNTKINIICGSVNSKKIADSIIEKVTVETKINIVDDSEETISEVLFKLGSNSVILGVGGGKLMDISKELAFQKSLELILFPTIISNDGLANGLVVLNSVNNSKSIYRKPADYIFIDFNIIESAPKKYLVSALGDVFSNYSAINDFEYRRGKYSTEQFFKAKESVLKSISIIETANDLEVEKIVDAINESSKSVEILKDSSAISGSEHLILHSLEDLCPNNNFYHGISVANITLFTLFLQQRLETKHYDIINKLDEKSFFLANCNVYEIKYEELFRLAKNYRNNRKTVLNEFTNKELKEKLIYFKDSFLSSDNYLVL